MTANLYLRFIRKIDGYTHFYVDYQICCSGAMEHVGSEWE
jgi:hypothetical protein